MIALPSAPRAIAKRAVELPRSPATARTARSPRTAETAPSAAETAASPSAATAEASSGAPTRATALTLGSLLSEGVSLVLLVPSALALAEHVGLLRLLQTAIERAVHQEGLIRVARRGSILLLLGAGLRGLGQRVDLGRLVQAQIAKPTLTRRAASRTAIGELLLRLGRPNFQRIIHVNRRIAGHQLAPGRREGHHVHRNVPRATGQVELVTAGVIRYGGEFLPAPGSGDGGAGNGQTRAANRAGDVRSGRRLGDGRDGQDHEQ